MDNVVCTMADIAEAMNNRILNPYEIGVQEAMRRGIDKTMRKMVRDTKSDAPVDGGKWRPAFQPHREGGTFAKHIAWKGEGKGVYHKATWYVKSPEYRLAHLLVNGHQLFVYGENAHRRTKAHPFLQDAFDVAQATVVPNIETELPS